jgi:hypothetical protein
MLAIDPSMHPPTLVAVEMGYGHLRPAHALACELGVEVLECDRAPLSDIDEQKQWKGVRRFYESVSRLSQIPAVGPPLRQLLETITSIPHLHPYRDLSAPTGGVKMLDWMASRGLGEGLIRHLRTTGSPLLTTYFAPAIVADRAGCESVHCVVTDTDINRVWAPMEGSRSQIVYFAPSRRVMRRLRAYGVKHELIHHTGYPLPPELLGGEDLPVLKKNLAARLVRLDPERLFVDRHLEDLNRVVGPLPREEAGKPPHVVFAVGGAGAQANLGDLFLPSFARSLREGRLRLTLVAGVRDAVAERFRRAIARHDVPAEILHEPRMSDYFRRFNALLAETDVLWTKPSEMTFFAALGLPLVFSWPVGVHEAYNRRWALEAGAGFKQGDPRFAAEWITDWLADGTLAAAAWAGYRNLPKRGLYRIAERFRYA